MLPWVLAVVAAVAAVPVAVVAWCTVRLVRFDGPLSVLRGFTVGELAELARPLPDFAWTVRSYAGFQLVLVGRRVAPPASASRRPEEPSGP